VDFPRGEFASRLRLVTKVFRFLQLVSMGFQGRFLETGYCLSSSCQKKKKLHGLSGCGG
jgi:hypothetical protein